MVNVAVVSRMKDSHSERHENLFALSDTEVEDFKENKFDRCLV